MFLSYVVGVGAMVTVMFDQSFYVLLIAACLLGISVCPIWIIALSNVKDENRGREMGLIFFAWLAGLGAGMVVMNFLIGIFERLPLRETWDILRHHMKNMPGIMLQGLGVGMLLPVLPTPSSSCSSFGIVGFGMTVLSRALDRDGVAHLHHRKLHRPRLRHHAACVE